MTQTCHKQQQPEGNKQNAKGGEGGLARFRRQERVCGQMSEGRERERLGSVRGHRSDTIRLWGGNQTFDLNTSQSIQLVPPPRETFVTLFIYKTVRAHTHHCTLINRAEEGGRGCKEHCKAQLIRRRDKLCNQREREDVIRLRRENVE